MANKPKKEIAVQTTDTEPRAPHVPDRTSRKVVRRMAYAGYSQDDIGEVIGVSGQTISNHYKHELGSAKTVLTRVANVLYKKALAGDTTAAIFILKCRANWRDRDPVQIALQTNVHAPSRDQLDSETALLSKIETLRPMRQEVIAHATTP